jgi:hypothetical protein
MWTRWTTRALRGGVAFGGGCTAVAIWQATSLQQHYLSKPRLKPHTGANSGLLVYHDDNAAAAADDDDATTSLSRFPRRWFWRSKQQPQPQPQQHEQQQRPGQHGAHDNNDEDEKEDRVVAKKMARILKDTLSDALRTIESKTEALLVRKPSTLLETARDTWARLRGGGTPSDAPPRKKIRLIILGDSLVCGVGCEDGNVHRAAASPAAPSITGHVLPQIVARVLSLAMRADVEWCSAGLVGGTVADVRTTLLPEMRQKLTVTAVAAAAAAATAAPATGKSASPSTPEEVVLVVICGLNDFKQIAIDFPYTTGPAAFKSELKHMLTDIDAVGRDLNLQFKVFLPAIPFVCGRGDTSSPLMALRPLSTFIEGAAFLWDSQKESLASGSKHITFIEAPSMTSHYATPGIGNFASDGIHPSRSGYTWYALHIAERMLQELCVHPSTAAAAGIDK